MRFFFEWDEQKAWSNERKHGISFDEAQNAFYDPHARVSYDPDHSQDEDRYILLGMSSDLQLLMVCHVYREPDRSIRIISARKATKREMLQYQDFLL
ncbi:MAG: BrnT family toxin [Prochlorotrichaceae cyanobacterium]|jgi:uncharacterized DUF497 family protein